MREFLEQLNALNLTDCVIESYDGWNLRLSGGSSLEHARPVGVFSGVSFISCPIQFSHPTFRVATESERQHVRTLVALDEGEMVVAVDAETMASLGSHVFYLVAQSGELGQ